MKMYVVSKCQGFMFPACILKLKYKLIHKRCSHKVVKNFLVYIFNNITHHVLYFVLILKTFSVHLDPLTLFDTFNIVSYI